MLQPSCIKELASEVSSFLKLNDSKRSSRVIFGDASKIMINDKAILLCLKFKMEDANLFQMFIMLQTLQTINYVWVNS